MVDVKTLSKCSDLRARATIDMTQHFVPLPAIDTMKPDELAKFDRLCRSDAPVDGAFRAYGYIATQKKRQRVPILIILIVAAGIAAIAKGFRAVDIMLAPPSNNYNDPGYYL